MYILSNEFFEFKVDDKGRCAGYRSKPGHQYVRTPSYMWKLIYSEGQRAERPVFAEGQEFTALMQQDSLTLRYEKLRSDDRELNVSLCLRFCAQGEQLSVTAEIDNQSDVPVVEFQLTALSGICALSGDPRQDYLMWPYKLGKIVPAPALSDLSVHAGFRTYEMPEFEHTDLNLLYPGVGSMQWFDLCNQKEGIYVGSHDAGHQTVCLRVERSVKRNELSMGVIKYPFCNPKEHWESEPLVYVAHRGDWHAGAKLYRKWLAESGTWSAPVIPEWAKEFQGWLRLILKPHHCEINWDYSKIPELFDKTRQAGMNTLFLLGWEQGGFARMWPDYEVAEDMGGREGLMKGIDYVHAKGGKVILFLSYFLIDHQSKFYKEQGGDKCTIKTVWGEDLPFAETYCGEGTYRKICNPPMPMYAACPSVQAWQDKMIESIKYCMELGADGVLLDLGGRDASLCFATDHPHKKPSLAHADKDKKYEQLRRVVKSYGEDKILLQEYNVDIFGQHMDIIHSSLCAPRSAKRPELYRYTFPELVVTNRGMAMDEKNYLDNVNFTFVMGMSYDLSIYRCLGLPEDIPNYIDYMKKALAKREENAPWLKRGTFVDTDGFSVDNENIMAKGYLAEDGSLGVALWNMGKETLCFTVTGENGTVVTKEMAPDTIDFCGL